MKHPQFASLTAKVAAGVAGLALATGGAGVALASQADTGRTLPVSAAEAALEAAGRQAEVTTTTTTTSTTVPSTTTTTVVEDEKDDEAKAEHPDNFGAMVSEDARDGGVDGQEISERAHARNEARRAEQTSAADEHRKNGDKVEPDEG